ncbi:MAG: hypothetical protein Q8L37_01325 [Candidatus Gottesmanbacteria bacterium]|nr:hypothetical protein [Candidatus Gottesmanbacteria bacterium]
MQDYKTVISIITVILSIVGYIPYYLDIYKGKTTPHIYSWFIWGLATVIAFALQVSAGAGVGSWMTLIIALNAFFIFFLGLRNGKKDVTRSDTVFFVLSLVAIFIWIVAKQPVVSIILISTVEMFGFIPTIRKSWNKPYSETFFTYALSTFRHGLSIFALQQYNIITWLYPVTWALANALFSIMLIMRRGVVGKKQGK